MNFSQNKPKVYFKTFGCRTNVFDTQVMMSNLKDFEVTQDESLADVVVINSCTVTNSADSTARGYINGLKKLSKNLSSFKSKSLIFSFCECPNNESTLFSLKRVSPFVQTPHPVNITLGFCGSFFNEFI